MNVLLIGSGGREHGLAWQLAQSPMLTTLWATPGNPGIRAEIDKVNARRSASLTGPEIGQHGLCFTTDLKNHPAIVGFCSTYAIDLVVIGPEAPLVAGLADVLRAAGIDVFGPDRAAARLEGSKSFTKALCDRANIPTARYRAVRSRDAAQAALADFGIPVVIKADGLAAGKGVTVAMTRAEADTAIADLFAVSGAEAVIEEFLEGEEVSLFVLSDGVTIMPFGSAQDHKRVGEGDTGPNTGGMGAYSPAPVLTPELEARAMNEIVAPTIAAMAADGTPFSGVLFAGLMLTAQGPKLIEYNVRFGDPECEVLMLRYRGDLLALMLATAQGRLAKQPAPAFAPDTALTVMLAADNYPGTPDTGGVIAGLDRAEAQGVRVFHAGTRIVDGTLVAAGGRVLAVTAMASDIATAQAAAYRAVDAIDFPSGFCRRDIGWREVARAKARAKG